MTITAEQREERRKHLGSSDAAAILGLDPHKQAFDVWVSKMSEEPDEPTLEMEVGNRLESLILDRAQERLGQLGFKLPITHPGGIVRVHTDAVVVETGEPVEAKAIGILGHSAVIPLWADGLPPYVWIQVAVQIACCRKDAGHVVALVRNEERYYHVEPKASVVDGIVESMHRFWERYVVTGKPPALVRPVDPSLLKAIKREPGKVEAFTTTDLVDVYREAKRRRDELAAVWRQVDRDYEHARNAVNAMMGTAEAATWPDGSEAVIKPITKKPRPAGVEQRLTIHLNGEASDGEE